MAAKTPLRENLLNSLAGNPSLWQALLEGTPTGAVLVDRDFTILDANPALLGCLQQEKDQVLGRKCHQVIFGSPTPCRIGSDPCPTSVAFATSQPADAVVLNRQQEPGAVQFLEVSSFPIRDEQGEVPWALEFVRDVTAPKLLQEFREEAALRDPITGLLNRKAFHRSLDRELKRAQRQRHPTSLALIDIDSFKDYNEKHGEEAGDQLLARLGELLVRCTRKEVDRVFRLQADRFCLILPETSPQAAAQIRERIRAGEKETLFPTLFSMAVCMAAPGEAADQLYHRAEESLYLAKKTREDLLS